MESQKDHIVITESVYGKVKSVHPFSKGYGILIEELDGSMRMVTWPIELFPNIKVGQEISIEYAEHYHSSISAMTGCLQDPNEATIYF